MPKTGRECERWKRQFEKLLRFTSALRGRDEGGDAFVVFEELRPGDGPEAQKKESVAARRGLLVAAAVGAGTGREVGQLEWEEPGPKSGDAGEAPRFAQLWFSKDWFFMELPSTILAEPEADRILRERTGFRFLGTGAPLHNTEATVHAFNPFTKFYLHGDEQLASEELAYVWFDVWGLPLESGLLATACTQHGRPRTRRIMLL